MKVDSYLNYWLEAFESCIDELGKYKDFTPEEKLKAARLLQLAHENYGMSFGYDNIPHPSVETIKKLNDVINKTEKEKDEWRYAFTKNVCMRHNVHPSQVTVEKDGNADVYF